MSAADVPALAEYILSLWASKQFIKKVSELPRADYGLPWVPYETYMRAQLITVDPGQLGLLLVDFPPEKGEDNSLHIHPISDRIVTILRGSGEFVAVVDGQEQRYPVEVGDQVFMPRGTVHTFFSGPQGMLVESQHNPWIPLEDPNCLVYPKL